MATVWRWEGPLPGRWVKVARVPATEADAAVRQAGPIARAVSDDGREEWWRWKAYDGSHYSGHCRYL